YQTTKGIEQRLTNLYTVGLAHLLEQRLLVTEGRRAGRTPSGRITLLSSRRPTPSLGRLDFIDATACAGLGGTFTPPDRRARLPCDRALAAGACSRRRPSAGPSPPARGSARRRRG